ncbi:hypothetical protein RA28_20985 [Ruegeria sp. ANG-S4]|uniref:papain-like cysteine protease family protein n=1 Tax=Ruegeria sp. ANG-S4 TaxID=1577904 RepID=UPI00057D87F8|nr:papain-like cysteine protease family protein [Ruegeria sp. ANG-S4]KIC41354.1 hypothetical protein RA28_20985 [Ruegeria sp. ANG-S4]
MDIDLSAIALGAGANSKVLPIDFIFQTQSFWCWAACMQMVMGTPIQQCSLANEAFSISDDSCCEDGSTAQCNKPLRVILISSEWAKYSFNAEYFGEPFSKEKIKSTIDSGKPIEFGVKWRPIGGHAMLITGYTENSDGSFSLTVLDPLQGVIVDTYERVLEAFGKGEWKWSWVVSEEALGGDLMASLDSLSDEDAQRIAERLPNLLGGLPPEVTEKIAALGAEPVNISGYIEEKAAVVDPTGLGVSLVVMKQRYVPVRQGSDTLFYVVEPTEDALGAGQVSPSLYLPQKSHVGTTLDKAIAVAARKYPDHKQSILDYRPLQLGAVISERDADTRITIFRAPRSIMGDVATKDISLPELGIILAENDPIEGLPE